MSAPCQAACSPFATVDDLSEPCASLPNIDRWLAVATDLLFNLSGRQFPGTCADVVRPCSRWESDGLVSSAGLAGLGYGFGGYPGGWRNGWGACRCNRSERCGCGSVPEITLGAFPVVAVDRVLIDGSELDPSFYRVDDFRFLVRLPDADGVNRGWPCFPAGTLVTTSTGQKPIEHVRAGEMVLTHMNRWRRVLRSGKTGDSETVLVKGQGGAIRCTPDHRFYAAEVAQRGRKLGAPEWVEAKDLVGHAWAIPASAEALPVVLPRGWAMDGLSHDFWWFVGRWVGDGWTSPLPPSGTRGSGSNRVELCCGLHEADELEERLRGMGWKWLRREQRTGTRFSFVDGPLRAWLRGQFGVGASNKTLPSWLLSAPAAIRTEFLNGYLSADGWQTDDAVSVHLTSRPLAVGLKLLAASLGFAPSFYESRPPGIGTIEGRTVATKQTYRVDWKLNPRKAQHWQDGENVWGRVRSVTLDERVVPVFDLEVEEDHSFVAEGLVVHNCCQRVDLASTEPQTWEVQFRYGAMPDNAGVMACAAWACELAKAAAGDDCSLPERARTVASQNVTIDVSRPSDFMVNGDTGVRLVNIWLSSVNPSKLRARARVVDPGTHRRVRRITSPPGG